MTLAMTDPAREGNPPPGFPDGPELTALYQDLGGDSDAVQTIADRYDLTRKSVWAQVRKAQKADRWYAEVQRPDWRTRAACRAADPELFYCAEDDRDSVAQAKAMCDSCPVRATCLEDAVAMEVASTPFGIVGGQTASERLAEKRRVTRIPGT